jgi:hypothetical protein
MRNGAGQYNPPNSSWSPATNGVLATAGDFTALLNDLSAALTQSVSRDGQSPMQGNLPMGNNKVTGLSPGTATTDAATWAQLFGASTQADIASAATTDIGVQNTSFLRVTGTTTITSFGTSYRGPRFLTFAGAVTLTNSSTLVLPGGADITTAAGDSLIVIPGATSGTADKWVVMAYQKNAVPGTVDIPDGSITAAKLADNAAVKLTLDQTIAGVKTFSSSPVVPNATTATQALAFGQVSTANAAPVKTALNASGDAPIYACRAWVNFNGTGTVVIRASGNVSSITDNGTGDYTVNFTTAMPDANYSFVGNGNGEGLTQFGRVINAPWQTAPSTSSIRFLTASTTATSDPGRNLDYIFCAIFR